MDLAEKLGYVFKKPALLKIALTHRSAENENNERMEFLGDSIVNFVIAEALFKQFPDAKEGDLSRFRATLINRETLALLGRQFMLGRYLHLGPGELKNGGTERSSIISCAMEAIIGAIYLDGGFDITRECILNWYRPLLISLTNAPTHKDPKTQLQEYLQSQHQTLPQYDVESIQGEAHQQLFIVRCSLPGMHLISTGKGTNRRRAEQDAAENMLGIIKK